MNSVAMEMAGLPDDQVAAILAGMKADELEQLLYEWRFWARPEQVAPDWDWLTWVILAGRGFGKTKSGAEWVREQVDAGRQRIALIGETYKDLVEVMVYGDSGLANVFPKGQEPKIVCNPNVQITFHTGAVALGYNATQPDQLRGPQFDAAWCDELAKWKKAQETWDMLQFGLRLGDNPQTMVTTTPRNIPTLKKILANKKTAVSTGSTRDNMGNLAQSFIDEIHERYAGTRLGRQELEAELLDDIPGALWTREMFDRNRLMDPNELPDLQRIVVAVDPSGTDGDEDEGDSIGIVVAGLGVDDIVYVLADRTCKLSPAGWGKRTVQAYVKYGADRIVAERNYGGAMVKHVVQTSAKSLKETVAYREVTASRGKVVRAEPVAALYEQGKVSHVGAFEQLEDQCCNFASGGYEGEGSPDRADALVWAITDLKLRTKAPTPRSGKYGQR